jgi:hypothetical protein
MPNDPLVTHFLQHFVENEWSPDTDRHQVLAIAAAGLVTVPVFVTMFMALKYLMRPFQAAGWTEVTAMGDQVTFCAVSLLVSALIAALEWNALSLTARDRAILGVLPISDGRLMRAKTTALVIFAGGFVLALNAVPALLHPFLMAAQLPMSVLRVLPLIGAHLFSTGLAGAFGFAGVVAIRETAYRICGPATFPRVSAALQTALVFSLLLALLLVPVRLSGDARWVFSEERPGVVLAPVSWFAATHAALAGRVLDSLPRPNLPARMAIEEQRFTAVYRTARTRLDVRALWGVASATLITVFALALHLWNSRGQNRLLTLSQHGKWMPRLRLLDAVASLVARDRPCRTGVRFLIQAVLGSPPHRLSFILSVVVAIAVVVLIGAVPTAGYALGAAPVRTLTIAAQTLAICAVVAGFRTAVRTAADSRGAWLFTVTDVDSAARFRAGVRRGGIAIVVLTVALLLPIHVANWGWFVAGLHALNGLALGVLLVDGALYEVERPIVDSIPPADGLNTVGVTLLGGAVVLLFAISKFESVALRDRQSAVVFSALLLVPHARRFFRHRPAPIGTRGVPLIHG